MNIHEIKKAVKDVHATVSFITDNDLIPELEVWMKRSIWGAGSRPTIYEAMKVRDWAEASLTEKIILFEAALMMQEMKSSQAQVPALA